MIFFLLKDVLMTTTGTALMWQAWRQGMALRPWENTGGAAPGCGIIALKVLDRYGTKPGGRAACHPLDPGVPAAVPNSGGKYFRWHHLQFQKDHVRLVESVEQLWDEGMVVVTAAGNQGPRPGSITAPGSRKGDHSRLQRPSGRAERHLRKRAYQQSASASQIS